MHPPEMLRSISGWAIAAVILSVVAPLAVMTPFALPLTIPAVVFSMLAVRECRRYEMLGLEPALIAGGAALLFAVTSPCYYWYVYQGECVEGHQRLNFNQMVSDRSLNVRQALLRIEDLERYKSGKQNPDEHPLLDGYAGKKVCLKGFVGRTGSSSSAALLSPDGGLYVGGRLVELDLSLKPSWVQSCNAVSISGTLLMNDEPEDAASSNVRPRYRMIDCVLRRTTTMFDHLFRLDEGC